MKEQSKVKSLFNQSIGLLRANNDGTFGNEIKFYRKSPLYPSIIFSVERLSDGKIFSINDTLSDGNYIQKIIIIYKDDEEFTYVKHSGISEGSWMVKLSEIELA